MKKVNLEILELEQKIAPGVLNASLFGGIDLFNAGSTPVADYSYFDTGWSNTQIGIESYVQNSYDPMDIIQGSGWGQTVSQTESFLDPISVGYTSNWDVTSYYADSAINYLHNQPGYALSQWSVTVYQTESALNFLGSYNSFWY